MTPAIGFLLYLIAFILLPFELVHAQSHLNRAWRLERDEEAKRAIGMRPEGVRSS